MYRESPLGYACILLWLLSELFEQLPEVGMRTNRVSSCSLMKRTCCSVTRPKRCSTGSNKSCG
ncbi:helicase HerA-like domain-containing protein [Halopseudomonas pachastrellae]|nr:helicase HerA-like domain-containing protein [Halopseudomonas pachastrellae]